jgi:hypothetical protein
MHHDEIITPWIKSSYSNSGANCVEVAHTALGNVAVHDSKDPHGPVMRFTPRAWQAFVARIKDAG